MSEVERLTRRAFAGVCGAGVLSAATAPRRIIDVHHHVFPPAFLQALEKADQMTAPGKAWSLQRSLDDMDAAGIATAMVSITTPGASVASGDTARKLARDCNEYMARIASDHQGRFGVFACLPWPDVEGSLREIEYALDVLKAGGIGMLTSYRDKWFGDPLFAPVWEELNRRKAVVYTHPTTANCCRNLLMPALPDSAIEYGTDTTRAIATTVFSGTAQKYRDMRIIFSHAGGTMPFLFERFVNLAKTPQYATKMPMGFAPEAVRFFYDTAQVSNAAAMSALRKVVPVTQVVFGTDYPFRTSAEHVKGLRECGVFTEAQIRAIEVENPRRCLATDGHG